MLKLKVSYLTGPMLQEFFNWWSNASKFYDFENTYILVHSHRKLKFLEVINELENIVISVAFEDTDNKNRILQYTIDISDYNIDIVYKSTYSAFESQYTVKKKSTCAISNKEDKMLFDMLKRLIEISVSEYRIYCSGGYCSETIPLRLRRFFKGL